LKLSTGYEMPVLGLGTWEMTGQTCVNAVKEALKIGYRHIDTAEFYRNHKDIAQGIKESGVPRDEIFITSKVWSTNLSEDDVLEACEKALKELQTDYIDLYLIHWPNHRIPIEETAEAFNILLNQQKIRSAGVSNFDIRDLKMALDVGMQISNNQIEYHPTLIRDDLKHYCEENEITVTAYSPLGHKEDLDLKEIKKIADKHDKSVAQVIIRWVIQKGLIAIPKASSPTHLKENFDVFNWKLVDEEIQTINSLDQGISVI